MSLGGFARFHAGRALDRWRESSPRAVSMPSHTGIGLGNMFSFWLWAHHGRLEGRDWWVRRTDAMRPWEQIFPAVSELLLDESDLKLRDRRDHRWYQHFDAFPRTHLESFITERLLTSDALSDSSSAPLTTVTVNVRRGDYYSDPDLRGLYGFDIVGYLREAMVGSATQGPITDVAVVSDDPAWCRANLEFLTEFGAVSYQPSADGPVQNLAQLAAAPRLVLANSSFSYWAGYLSNVRFGSYETVWAPGFHRRGINDGKAFQLDPRWSEIEDLPGGWDRWLLESEADQR